jgi:MFS family permease
VGERPSRRGLWAITVLSLVLNLAGITWGLPARWHPDEKADEAARLLHERTLDPGSFINPSLPVYLMLPAIALQQRLAAAGLVTDRFADPLIAGRALSALAAAAAVYLAGRLALATPLGLLPALLLAVAPGVVNLAHFATPEPWLLLGAVATLLVAFRHLDGRMPAWALGLAVGLTASTKYTAAAFLAPALAAVWLRPRGAPSERERGLVLACGVLLLAAGGGFAAGIDRALAARLHLKDARLLHPEHALGFVRGVGGTALLAGAALVALALIARERPWARRLVSLDVPVLGAAAAGGFLIGTPYALFHPIPVLSDLAFNRQTQFEYKGLVGASTSYGAYMSLLGDALTWPLVAAVVLGLLVAAGRGLTGDARALVLLLAAITPYLLVASGGHQALRFLTPVLAPAALLAALGLRALPRFARTASSLVVARALLEAVLVVRLFYVDSRQLAAEWIETNVPVGATVDLIANVPGYGPTLPEGRTLRLVPTLSREMAPAERFEEAARAYATQASPWLVLTASYYERFLEHPEQRPERARFFGELLEGRGDFEVVARFRQHGWLRPAAEFVDPEIVILRRRE